MEWVFSDAMLEDSASRQDGIEAPLEKSYRRKTAWFIEELGKEIKWSVVDGIPHIMEFFPGVENRFRI